MDILLIMKGCIYFKIYLPVHWMELKKQQHTSIVTASFTHEGKPITSDNKWQKIREKNSILVFNYTTNIFASYVAEIWLTLCKYCYLGRIVHVIQSKKVIMNSCLQ